MAARRGDCHENALLAAGPPQLPGSTVRLPKLPVELLPRCTRRATDVAAATRTTRSPSGWSTHAAGPTTGASKRPARPSSKRCAASSAGSPTPSTANSSPTPNKRNSSARLSQLTRAREGTAGRLKNPARSTYPRTSTLRISHFPDPQLRRYNRPGLPGRPPSQGRPKPPVDNKGEPE
jgi:hypothetical protein